MEIKTIYLSIEYILMLFIRRKLFCYSFILPFRCAKSFLTVKKSNTL